MSAAQTSCWVATSRSTSAPIASSCWPGVSPSIERSSTPEQLVRLEPGDPDHEEFVEIVGRDRQEAKPLEQRVARVARLIEHAPVERQPAQLAVEIALLDDRLWAARARSRPESRAAATDASRPLVSTGIAWVWIWPRHDAKLKQDACYNGVTIYAPSAIEGRQCVAKDKKAKKKSKQRKAAEATQVGGDEPDGPGSGCRGAGRDRRRAQGFEEGAGDGRAGRRPDRENGRGRRPEGQGAVGAGARSRAARRRHRPGEAQGQGEAAKPRQAQGQGMPPSRRPSAEAAKARRPRPARRKPREKPRLRR